MKNISIKAFILISFSLLLIFSMSCQSGGHDHAHSHDGEEHAHAHAASDEDHTHSHDDGHSHSHGHGGDGHTHASTGDRPAFTYLGMNGEFKMNPGDSMTQNDPRNPSRLDLTTTDKAGSLTRIAFYDHADMNKQLADCGYQFMGSRPDPHYFPDASKTSIWDVFKRTEEYAGDCAKYEYVISRSPHGDPIHMHFRYGNDVEELLAMSNDEADNQFNPWWATYCALDQENPCD
ncbi:MAG: hypothetical protein AAF849_14315 [Bacteroidota bacterium]